jgi:hypothetical protein
MTLAFLFADIVALRLARGHAMIADRRRSKKGKAWQQVVNDLRKVDPTIPVDLAPRKPDGLLSLRRDRRRSARPKIRRSSTSRGRGGASLRPGRSGTWSKAPRGAVQFVPYELDEELAIAKTLVGLGLTSEAAAGPLDRQVRSVRSNLPTSCRG